jgi:phosphatidylserine/phosphatidylglycerophosphate/cardiolipin synthase-like enzyme
VIDVINSAKSRLLLSIFRCDDRPVLEALAAACRRNVRVEALLTRHAKHAKTSLRLLHLLLEQLGVCVWRYPDPLTTYHSKYVVADDRLALIGSLNLTRKCFKKTADFLVVTQDKQVVHGLTVLFENDCRSRAAQHGLSTRLILAPSAARRHIVDLFHAAQRTICIIDPKLTDEKMIQALSARAQAGVTVQTLTSKRVAGFASHGKLIILDGRQAIVGSMGLSSAHLDTRRELALVIEEPTAVADLVAFFDAAVNFDRPRPLSASARSVA